MWTITPGSTKARRDPSQAGQDSDRSSPPASLPLKARVLNFLEERPGIPFEPEELASEFGGNRDAIRKTLDRQWMSGLIQFEERTKQAGKGTTKYKVYLVAEFVQRLESPYSNGLGAGQPLTSALDKVDVSSAKIEPVQRSQSPNSKDLSALDKPDSGIDPTSKTDFQSNIFLSLPAPRSKEPRLGPKPGVAPKVGDLVMTPAGQGVVRMTYPNGQFGVDLEGGRSFSAVSASEITVLGFS